jgi:DNA modification methylase
VRYPKGTTEHPLNKSKKQEILVSVWDFGATHPQSERCHYICNDHPAKMRPTSARVILELYGESPVLDPMAGIGTTLVEAMSLGMNAIGVEYEKKFVDQAIKNIKHFKKIYPNKNLGKAICIQGDSRNLSCLKNVNSLLFSPPYFNALKKGDAGPHSSSKRISYEERVKRFQGYSTNSNNIGNVRRFGSIVFSPPYFDALSVNKGGGSKNSILHEETTKELQMQRSGPFAVKKNLPMPYSSKEENIGNVSEFGSVIISPPYEGALNATKHTISGIVSREPQLAKTVLYSRRKGNIGNAVGQTYLGEMFKVYGECYRVLKPGKFMVVVVKDIQRNWKTIPLGADTIKLCQLAGFDCHDVIINKMYFPSFWMLSLAKNSQRENVKRTRRFHVLKSHEYILVFRKSFKH